MSGFSSILGVYTGVIGSALQQSQARTRDAFDSQNPIATAPTPVSVSVSAAGDTKVEHKLMRVPSGVTISKNGEPATVYETQPADSRFVYLASTNVTPHTVEVLVF